MASRYARLLEEISREFPGFQVVRKDRSWFARLLHGALVVCTLGAQRRFLTDYQTTIGRTVYVTPDWDDLADEDRYVTMRHERVHLRQFRRYTLPGMAILYLLLPLPVGLAWFRARFEKEGYAETLRAAAEVRGPAVLRGPLREHVIEQFVSGAYGWMWPFRRSIGDWYDRQARELGA